MSPPFFAGPSKYKPYLKEEFFSRCVYCRIPDAAKGADSFEVDHYRPKSKFPELAATYRNLFYACNTCNRKKGAFWPTEEQRKAGSFIPNPCEHFMFDHLRYRDLQVEPKSPTGKWTITALDLNEAGRIDHRQTVSNAIHYAERVKRQLQVTLSKLELRTVAETSSPEKIAQEKEAVQRQLVKVQQHLDRFLG